MKKEYGIVFHKSVYIFCFVAFSALAVLCLYVGIVKSWAWFTVIMLALILPWVFLSYFYFPRLKIIVDNDRLLIKMPDKTTQIMMKDIYRIDKELGWGSHGFYIRYNENGRNRIASFSDQVQGYSEILSYIERKRPKDHPLSRENPIKKILRIIFLIIMYLLMFGLPLFSFLYRN